MLKDYSVTVPENQEISVGELVHNKKVSINPLGEII